MTGAELAEAARSLVGTRFRLGGRHPATGLDCIGLLEAALHRCGRPARLPNGYSLRLRDADAWLPSPAEAGFITAAPPFAPGDAVLLRVGPAQFHLAIHGAAGDWIHAHAGLRRVARQSAMPTGEVIHHWRPAPCN